MKTFVHEVLSEPDGKGSLARIGTALAMFFSLGWVTFIVYREHKLPDFTGLCLFIGTLYGLNLAGGTIRHITAGKEQMTQFIDDMTKASATPAPTP
jgi:hypothetical protein